MSIQKEHYVVQSAKHCPIGTHHTWLDLARYETIDAARVAIKGMQRCTKEYVYQIMKRWTVQERVG